MWSSDPTERDPRGNPHIRCAPIPLGTTRLQVPCPGTPIAKTLQPAVWPNLGAGATLAFPMVQPPPWQHPPWSSIPHGSIPHGPASSMVSAGGLSAPVAPPGQGPAWLLSLLFPVSRRAPGMTHFQGARRAEAGTAGSPHPPRGHPRSREPNEPPVRAPHRGAGDKPVSAGACSGAGFGGRLLGEMPGGGCQGSAAEEGGMLQGCAGKGKKKSRELRWVMRRDRSRSEPRGCGRGRIFSLAPHLQRAWRGQGTPGGPRGHLGSPTMTRHAQICAPQ